MNRSFFKKPKAKNNKKPLKLGIPYMGSKRRIAGKIVDHILSENPDCKYVYDLFGGGGAISFEFLQRKQIKQVYFNEFNTGVCELLKKIQKDGVTEEFYQWISREDFHKHKNDDDWFGGLVKTCWSFGNNQITYMFSPDIERYKKMYHEVVVENKNNLKDMSEFCENYVFEKYGIKQECILKMPIEKEYQKRRLEIRKQLTEYEKICKNVKPLRQLERLQRLEQLERLERVQQLEQLERSGRLGIINKSYENVKIETPIDETIIYLDPPYGKSNCGGYQGNQNFKEINNQVIEYIKNSEYTIYLSGYESDLNCVLELEHSTSISQKQTTKTIEKLFCNKV